MLYNNVSFAISEYTLGREVKYMPNNPVWIAVTRPIMIVMIADQKSIRD